MSWEFGSLGAERLGCRTYETLASGWGLALLRVEGATFASGCLLTRCKEFHTFSVSMFKTVSEDGPQE